MRIVSRVTFYFALALSVFALGDSPSEAQLQTGTLSVGSEARPPGLGNPYTGIGPPSTLYWRAIFDSLTEITKKGEVLPSLAISWSALTETRWTIQLRQGVYFHNGKLFDANAVKFSLDLLKTPDAGSWPVSGEFKTVIGSTIKNQFAIEVETSSPDPLLPRRLSLLRIVEPEAWKSEGESSFARKPIGTGPYTVADWGPSSGQTRLDRYSNAWRPSTIETILIRAIPDPTARLQALLSGQIDVAAGLSIEDRNVLLSNGLSVQSEVLPQVMSIAFRTVDNEDSPIANQAVRQALNYAIDRNLIAEILQEGTTSPASQGAIPGVFGFNPNVPPYPFDPDKGKQLLESAGFGDGFSLNVLAPSSSSTTQAILLKAAQDLSRIGVKINYRTTTFSEWLRRYTSGTWDDIDAFMITWNAATYYDAARPMEYFSCLKNKPFFCSEHVASLIEMASRETSEQEREKLLFEIQAILKEIAPSIILSPMTYTFGYKSPSGKLPTLQTTIDFSAIDSNH